MSTRAQIKVQGSEIMIYKHSDGYPSEVLPTLVDIMKTFIRARGNEPDYALAQIMRAFARRDEQRRKERLKETKMALKKWEDDKESPEYNSFKMWEEMYSEQSMTGWGLDCTAHGDIEYLYQVDLKKGRVIVNDLWNGDVEYHSLIEEE